MELNQRESEYLVKYLKEVHGKFWCDDSFTIDPNDSDYKEITAEDVIFLNKGLLVKYKFVNEDWTSEFTVNISLISFIIFCSQQKEESK